MKERDRSEACAGDFYPAFAVCAENLGKMRALIDGDDVMSAWGVRAAAKPDRNGADGTFGGAVAGATAAEPIIDEAHLERMTLGDRGLEREVLQIFVRQAALMMGRIAEAEPAFVAAAAHTLTGSARGIGAWRVAQAAERLERASSTGREALNAAIADLKAASREASAAIGARLADPASGI